MTSQSIFSLIILFFSVSMVAQPSERIKNIILTEINDLRAEGCKCGGKRMKPVGPVTWSDLLYDTAASHASEMDKYKFFGHYSRSGKDIGDRFDDFKYNWRFAGENLGEGQENFFEVVQDWIDSPSHCRMLMNGDMTEMAVAKRGRYWVQHFGTPMPKNYKRTSRNYSEGN